MWRQNVAQHDAPAITIPVYSNNQFRVYPALSHFLIVALAIRCSYNQTRTPVLLGMLYLEWEMDKIPASQETVGMDADFTILLLLTSFTGL
jgi:hypothetical protein